MNLFSTLVISIFIEVMPFLIIGSLLSSIVEVFLSQERLMRFMPKSVFGGIALGIGAGFVLPTCECGVVPVVRGFINKGAPPYIAIAYMLAAPIVNPIVLVSTFMAFSGNLTMVFARIAMAVIVASIMGLYIKRFTNILKQDKTKSHQHNHDHSRDSFKMKMKAVCIHTAREFIYMGKYVIIGALAASAFKTFMPLEVIMMFNENMLLSIVGMVILAILLSICSEADAFVAASFQSFPLCAKLAFIGIGPMVDLKLIGMYGATFKSNVVRSLIIGPIIMVTILSWIFEKLFVV